jgi:hypothetical protein
MFLQDMHYADFGDDEVSNFVRLPTATIRDANTD